jgi:hypothetical protein
VICRLLARLEDLVGIDSADRLFVVSHRWALDTATAAELVAGDEVASIRVATPSALVAMKSGALLGGRMPEPASGRRTSTTSIASSASTTGAAASPMGCARHRFTGAR